MRRYELTDQEWERIKDLLPGKVGDPGRSGEDNRRFLNGIFWLARSGAPWRDLPDRYGKWNSVYKRFNRWAKKEVWEHLFQTLQDPNLDQLMLDSTTVKAHQHSAGQKK